MKTRTRTQVINEVVSRHGNEKFFNAVLEAAIDEAVASKNGYINGEIFISGVELYNAREYGYYNGHLLNIAWRVAFRDANYGIYTKGGKPYDLRSARARLRRHRKSQRKTA